MAYTEGLCPQIQQAAVNVFGANIPALKRRRLGFLESVMSSYNRDGFQVIQLDGGNRGKIRTVQIVYDDAYCLNVAAGAYDCTAPTADANKTEPSPQEVLITLPSNPYVMKSTANGTPVQRLKLTDWEIRKLCENKDMFISRQITSWLLNFEEGLNKALLAEYAALIGTFADGDTEKNIPLYANDAAGINQPLKSAQHTLRNEYMNIRAQGQPIVIGSRLFQNYNSDVNNGCCNLNGVMMQPTNMGWYFFEDDYIETVIGSGYISVLAPGAVQVVTWNKYQSGAEQEDHEQLVRGTIISPWTGMEYDMKMFYDVSCEAWYLELFSYSKIVVVPAGGCGITGANGTLKFKACAEAETFTCEEAT